MRLGLDLNLESVQYDNYLSKDNLKFNLKTTFRLVILTSAVAQLATYENYPMKKHLNKIYLIFNLILCILWNVICNVKVVDKLQGQKPISEPPHCKGRRLTLAFCGQKFVPWCLNIQAAAPNSAIFTLLLNLFDS